ncbi:ABC transporter substrate-binding protein, partial [Desulfobacterales bacterium HSG16]|nr:ABC transporter substrate-binding protein [Desulfobacterales bacterium HSG16]
MDKSITRREFLIKSAAGAATAGLSTTPFQAYAEKSKTLRIGYLPITDATPLLIAHAMGFFQDEGLDVTTPVRVRSWSTLSESFMTGKFNLTHMLLPIPVWMRYNINAPVKVLAWDHTNGSAVTVRQDSGINGFADMGGRQIAVPYWYSMHNIILQMGIEKAGLKPVIQNQSIPLKKNEVNLFILPPSEMPLALSGNKIDGFIVAEPFNAVSEIKTGARIMRFTGDIWKNHPCCVVVMNENVTSSNPIFTQKAINAVVRAQLWVTQNPEKAAKILGRDGKKYLPVSEKILLRVFKGYELSKYGKGNIPQAILHPEWSAKRLGFQPYPYPSATRFILRQMQKTLMEGDTEFLKKLDPDFVINDLVDDTFVKHAIEDVGGPSKFDEIDIEHNTFDRE